MEYVPKNIYICFFKFVFWYQYGSNQPIGFDCPIYHPGLLQHIMLKILTHLKCHVTKYNSFARTVRGLYGLTIWMNEYISTKNCLMDIPRYTPQIATNKIITNRKKHTILCILQNRHRSWWRHQMKTFSTFLASCAENSPITGEFPLQRSVTRSFGVVFYQRVNKRFSKQSRCGRFETPSRSWWRQCKVLLGIVLLRLYKLFSMDSCDIFVNPL